ncbi:MAG: DUF3108 domain-containing protein [Hydrotalea sp.]|nr:DUF3108 domain-containing protein [Hydrotalea sp.]
MQKFLRFFLLAMLVVALPGCPIIPKWGQIEKGTTVPLDSFKKEVIKKNQEETDPRYKEHQYDYRSTVDGLPAADATFWLKINRDNTYQARAEFNMIAPWTTVFNAVGRQQIKGRVVNGRFLPSQMSGLFKVGDKKFQITVTYPKDGGAPITKLDPPRNQAAITPIDQKLLANSYDITSALLTLMSQYQKNGPAVACTQRLVTWDGFRLARIKLYPDANDPNQCTADFERVGGFLKSNEKKAKSRPSTLTFRVDKRFALPVTISADTFFVQPVLALKAVDDVPISYYYLPANLNKTPFDEN